MDQPFPTAYSNRLLELDRHRGNEEEESEERSMFERIVEDPPEVPVGAPDSCKYFCEEFPTGENNTLEWWIQLADDSDKLQYILWAYYKKFFEHLSEKDLENLPIKKWSHAKRRKKEHTYFWMERISPRARLHLRTINRNLSFLNTFAIILRIRRKKKRTSHVSSPKP